MKTNNFVRMVSLVLAMTLAGANSFAEAAEGQNGNGGGGLKRNGRYMTFYSAGFYAEGMDKSAGEIPQMLSLLNFFGTTDLMGERSKAKYLSALTPTSARRYYSVDKEKFTPEVRARLIAEYARVMSTGTEEIAIFAVTDTTSRTTYLLPEFYMLNGVEQKAILFHEAFWIAYPKATYQQVIDAEMAFQAFLELPTNDSTLKWLQVAGTTNDLLVGAVQSDLRTGALKGFIAKTKPKGRLGVPQRQSGRDIISAVLPQGASVALIDLLGRGFFDCRNNNGGAECGELVSSHVYGLTQKFPSSLFLQRFYSSLNNRTVDFSIMNGGCLYANRTDWNHGMYTSSYDVLTYRCGGEFLPSAHVFLETGNLVTGANLIIRNYDINGYLTIGR